MTNIAILASGNGTNAQRIIEYFADDREINIALIISNKEDAYVRQRALRYGIKEAYVSKEDITNTDKVSRLLNKNLVEWIILAGFMQLIPEKLIKEYDHHIINIHPALLPKFGGKGMYGMRVHEAVIAKGAKTSGITIHYVNEEYDKGAIIFQANCKITEEDTPETLAEKIHELEYEHYPRVIGELIR